MVEMKKCRSKKEFLVNFAAFKLPDGGITFSPMPL
jgi:hypothetical protein